MCLEVEGRATFFNLLRDLPGRKPSGLTGALIADRLNLGHDCKRDRLGAVTPKIHANRREQVIATGLNRGAEHGCGLADKKAAAMARAEQTQVAGVEREDAYEKFAILLITMSHKDNSVGCRDVELCRQGHHAAGGRKTVWPSELRATVGHGHRPPKEGCHLDKRAGIFPGAEHEKTLGGGEALDEAPFVVSAWSERACTLYLFRAESRAGEEDLTQIIEDEAPQSAAVTREEADDGRLCAFERRGHADQESAPFGSSQGLVKEIDGTAASQAERDVGGVIKRHGVAFDGRVLASDPGGATYDLGFETAATDSAGVARGGGGEEAGAWAAIRGAFGSHQGHENRSRITSSECDNLTGLDHDSILA